jgi:WD40 repeat protein
MIKITKKIFASGHFYGNVKIWDITKPDGEECIKTFKEHSVWIYDLLKISETLIASCDVAGIINMWDLTKPENMAHIKIFYTIRLTGAKLTYTPKGRVIAGSINGEIADSNIKKPEASPAYETWYNGFINSIAYVPKNKIVIGNDNGKIVIMDMKKKGKFVFQSENPHIKQKLSGVITHMLTFSPNTILSCTNDGVITVWHLDKPYEWLQEIDGFSFLRKNYDYIVSFNYEEEEQTLILTTKNGLIITCDFNKNSKDKNYFFKNLKTSIKLQTFKDASIFY